MKYLVLFLALALSIFAETPPANRVKYGDPSNMFVEAVGTPPLRYQWYKDGVLLPGETGTVLHFPSLTEANVGAYHVTVTNDYGMATSDVAYVNIERSPTNAKVYFVVGKPVFKAPKA